MAIENKSLRLGLVDVRGPKRYSNGNGLGGDAERMYPKSEVAAGGPFLAGSTVYTNATPVLNGEALQKAQSDALGLAGKTQWSQKDPTKKEFEAQDYSGEQRFIGTGGFGVGIHCDAEGSWAAKADLTDYGSAEVSWTIK